MKDLLLLTSSSSAEETGESSGTMEKVLAIFKNPMFYIIVGGLFVLIVIIYFVRRFTRAKANTAIVIVRGGKIFKILDEKNPHYYRAPFIDSIGAVISLSEKTFTSEKLFINNGPDHLYKINYTFIFKTNNPERYFNCLLDGTQEIIETRINDSLRLFSEKGNASLIIKDYHSSEKSILKEINNAIDELGVEAVSFKVNYIEPIGK